MTQPAEVSSFLNQIFYKNNKFDDGDELSKLEDWMFTREKIERWNAKKVVESEIRVSEYIPLPVTPIQKPKINRFTPTKQDTLFWCAYVAHHGESAYWIIGNKYKNVEIEEKQAMIEYIKTNSSKIRGSTPKISQVRLQEIMSDLMMNRKTDWYTFHIMCMFYNIQVSIIFGKTFLHFTSSLNDSQENPVTSFVFERSHDGYISINYDSDVAKTGSLVQLEYMCDRPIKSIANYKLPELHDMALKLGIDESDIIVTHETETKSKSKTKPKKIDWYNAILKKCTW